MPLCLKGFLCFRVLSVTDCVLLDVVVFVVVIVCVCLKVFVHVVCDSLCDVVWFGCC